MLRNPPPGTNPRAEHDPDHEPTDGCAYETPDCGTRHPRADRSAHYVRADVHADGMANLLAHGVALQLVPVPGADDNDNDNDNLDHVVLHALGRRGLVYEVEQPMHIFRGARCLP